VSKKKLRSCWQLAAGTWQWKTNVRASATNKTMPSSAKLRCAEDGDQDAKFLERWNREVMRMESLLSSSPSPSPSPVHENSSAASSPVKPSGYPASFDESAMTVTPRRSGGGFSYYSSISSMDEPAQRTSLSSLSDVEEDPTEVSSSMRSEDEGLTREMTTVLLKLEKIQAMEALFDGVDDEDDGASVSSVEAERVTRELDDLLTRLSPMDATLGHVLSTTAVSPRPKRFTSFWFLAFCVSGLALAVIVRWFVVV